MSSDIDEDVFIDAPTSVGYWWWKATKEDKGRELCIVSSIDPLSAKFFNGAVIRNHAWGFWKKAEVK
jgi:hypothetical protein